VQVPRKIAQRVAGFRIQKEEDTMPMNASSMGRLPDDASVCFCERVTAGEIRKLIRNGVKDLNQIKAITRAGMGACGAKTCENLIMQLYREEGVSLEAVTPNTRRPVFVETPLGVFANISEGISTHE
jgi:NAD(P)H-nitrite reductase large subunit